MANKITPSKEKAIELKEAPVIPNNIESLIAMAIREKSPVEALERLLAMRRELRAEKAKEEYDKAMAAFQAECPTIEKTKIVYEKGSTKVRYKYAPLESIVEQVKELLAKHGFSYAITTVQDDKMLGVICKVTHERGHFETTTFSVPIGSESYMSDVQKYGARLTFAKRYAFCNAFGILTGDEDTDAQSKPEDHPTQPAQQTAQTQPTTLNQMKTEIARLMQEGKIEKDFTKLSKLTEDEAREVLAKI